MSAAATGLSDEQKAILKELGTRQESFTADQKAIYQELSRRSNGPTDGSGGKLDYLRFAGEFAKEMFRPRPQVALGAVKQAVKSAAPSIDPVFGSISKPQALEPKNPEQAAGAAQETAVELLPTVGATARGVSALRAAMKDGPGLVERALTNLAAKSENLSKPTQFALKSTPGIGKYFENLQKMFGPDLGKMSKLDTKQLAAKLYEETTGKLPATAQEQVDAMKALRAALKPETKAAAAAKAPVGKPLPIKPGRSFGPPEVKPGTPPEVKYTGRFKAPETAPGTPPPIRPGRSFAAPEPKTGVPPPVKYTGRFKQPAEAAEQVEQAVETAVKPKAKTATAPTRTPAGTPETGRPEPPASVRSGHAGENTPALRGAAEDVVHRNAQAKDLKMAEYFKSLNIDPDTISDAEFNKHLAKNGYKPAPKEYDPKLLRRALSAVRADIRSIMKKTGQ